VLGRTGLRVFEVGFGACAIGGSCAFLAYGPTDDGNSLRSIARALELDCNFFDTADVYGWGHSEALLGQALAGRRTEVILTTKAGHDFYHGPGRQNFEPGYLRFALYESLRRLKTDYIDVYQLHNPPLQVVYDPRTVAAMQTLQDEGRVRWLGISAATVYDAAAAVRAGWLDTIQVRYSLMAPETRLVVFPEAQARQIGIIAREPLANGFLTAKYRPDSRFPPEDFRSTRDAATLSDIARQVEAFKADLSGGETPAQRALRFVLEAPAVSVAIPGCKTVAQVEENFSTSLARKEDEDILDLL
jgi:aryl-alcohol dehydrogenase-like predicted oxidoreductase